VDMGLGDFVCCEARQGFLLLRYTSGSHYQK
jgi:hypothetical protein